MERMNDMKSDSKLYPNGVENYIKSGEKRITAVIAVITIVLIAAFLWGCIAYIDITQRTLAFSENGRLYVVVQAEKIDSVGIGTKFIINGVEYTADFEPSEVYHPYKTEGYEAFMSLPWVPNIPQNSFLSNFGLKETPLPEGWYVADIRVERCHPIKLLFE